MKPPPLTVLLLLATALAVPAEDRAPVPVERPHALLKTSLGDIELELFADETPLTVANFLDLAEGRREFRDVRTGQPAKRPFYDGLVFHRVIRGFMIQGGCPRGDGTGDPGYRFEDEIDAAALGLDEIDAFTPSLQPHQYLRGSFRSGQEMHARLIQPLFRKMGIGSQEQLEARKAEVEERLRKLTLKEAYEILGYVYRDGTGSHPPVKGVIAMANSGPATNGSQFFINLGDTPHLAGKHTVFGRVVAGMDVVTAIGAVGTGANDRPVEPVKILSIRKR